MVFARFSTEVRSTLFSNAMTLSPMASLASDAKDPRAPGAHVNTAHNTQYRRGTPAQQTREDLRAARTQLRAFAY